MTDQTDPYTREQLIEICERGIVPESDWCDRDSARSQKKLGQAWAWLRAGCEFEFTSDPKTDDKTVWIRIHAKGFNYFEGDYDGRGEKENELFYLPPPARLDARAGKDWY